MASPGPAAAIVPLGVQRGTVHRFDDPRGIGVVHGPHGVEFAFHCTAIADGTRTIAEGTDVTFRVVPGRLGRWEAGDLRPTLPSV